MSISQLAPIVPISQSRKYQAVAAYSRQSRKYQAVAAYSRLSRNPDGTVESVDHQKAIQEREVARIGGRISKHFWDDDEGAWDVNNDRPGWRAYLAALGSGEHDGASTYHQDRLSRNGPDAEALITVAMSRQLDLITPGRILQIGTNEQDRMMYRIWSAVVINQSDATSRRERDHKDEARENGKLRYALGGNPPFGFKDGEGDWETDPAHARLLRDVAARVVTGADIAPAYRAAMKAQGQPRLVTNVARDARGTKQAHMPVSVGIVKRALARPATYGLVTGRDGAVIGRARLDTPPPLDPDLYDQIQLGFRARQRGGRLPDGRFPLGPVLRCGRPMPGRPGGICGNTLSGGQQQDRRRQPDGTWAVVKSTPVYRCGNKHLEPDGQTWRAPCFGVSADAEALHAEVAGALGEWARHSPAYAAAAARQGGLDDRLAELYGQLDKARGRLKVIKAEWLQNVQADDEYADLITIGSAVVASLQEQIRKVKAARARPAVPGTIQWDKLTADRKRELVRMAWGTITVAPGRGGSRPLPMADRLSFG